MTESMATGTEGLATVPASLGRLSGGTRRTLAQEAEGFRVALSAGLVTPADVAAWAESAIQILGIEDSSLLSVAAAGAFPAEIVSRLLGRVSGPRNTSLAVADVLLAMHDQLERMPSQALPIAAGLERLAASGLAPDLAGEVGSWAFARRLEDALKGSYSSPALVTSELRDFLRRRIPPGALTRRALLEQRRGGPP
jgi:hypothetical protein